MTKACSLTCCNEWHFRDQTSCAMLNTLRQFAFPNKLAQATSLLPRCSVGPPFTCLQAVLFTSTSLCAIAEPSRAVDGSLSFPVSQPPSRLTLLFPFSQTRVKVITGGYETVQVKVSTTLRPRSTAHPQYVYFYPTGTASCA